MGYWVENAEKSMSAETPADSESRTGAAQDRNGEEKRSKVTRILVGASIILVSIGLGLGRFYSLPRDTRYFWPVSQDDWAAWGTWVSAAGAIAAVLYASRSIKQAIDVQKGTERELKEDRKHDRQQRELERDLVREEREALKAETDRIALYEAQQLSFKYMRSWPHDSEYLEVQHEVWEAEKLWNEKGIVAEEPEDQQLECIFVEVTNYSPSVVFDDLSLWLPEEGPKVTKVRLFERVAPPIRKNSSSLEGSPPDWNPRKDHESFFPAEKNQWSLGSIKPRRTLLVELSFETPQPYSDWDPDHLWNDEHASADPRRVILGYRDQEQRHWIRSTRSARNMPKRLLESSTIS